MCKIRYRAASRGIFYHSRKMNNERNVKNFLEIPYDTNFQPFLFQSLHAFAKNFCKITFFPRDAQVKNAIRWNTMGRKRASCPPLPPFLVSHKSVWIPGSIFP